MNFVGAYLTQHILSTLVVPYHNFVCACYKTRRRLVLFALRSTVQNLPFCRNKKYLIMSYEKGDVFVTVEGTDYSELESGGPVQGWTGVLRKHCYPKTSQPLRRNPSGTY
jgi:hypothetical protein